MTDDLLSGIEARRQRWTEGKSSAIAAVLIEDDTGDLLAEVRRLRVAAVDALQLMFAVLRAPVHKRECGMVYWRGGWGAGAWLHRDGCEKCQIERNLLLALGADPDTMPNAGYSPAGAWRTGAPTLAEVEAGAKWWWVRYPDHPEPYPVEMVIDEEGRAVMVSGSPYDSDVPAIGFRPNCEWSRCPAPDSLCHEPDSDEGVRPDPSCVHCGAPVDVSAYEDETVCKDEKACEARVDARDAKDAGVKWPT